MSTRKDYIGRASGEPAGPGRTRPLGPRRPQTHGSRGAHQCRRASASDRRGGHGRQRSGLRHVGCILTDARALDRARPDRGRHRRGSAGACAWWICCASTELDVEVCDPCSTTRQESASMAEPRVQHRSPLAGVAVTGPRRTHDRCRRRAHPRDHGHRRIGDRCPQGAQRRCGGGPFAARRFNRARCRETGSRQRPRSQRHRPGTVARDGANDRLRHSPRCAAGGSRWPGRSDGSGGWRE